MEKCVKKCDLVHPSFERRKGPAPMVRWPLHENSSRSAEGVKCSNTMTFFPGTSVYLFNYLSGISVGAKQNKSRLLYDAFKGIIAGVYFNGVRVIDRCVTEEHHCCCVKFTHHT